MSAVSVGGGFRFLRSAVGGDHPSPKSVRAKAYDARCKHSRLVLERRACQELCSAINKIDDEFHDSEEEVLTACAGRNRQSNAMDWAAEKGLFAF